MQNGLFYIAVIFQCCLYSCIEVPVVLPTGSDPTTNQTTQNVLIEEYTGVRCQNCPAGAQLLEELKTIHGDQLIILSIRKTNSLWIILLVHNSSPDLINLRAIPPP